MAAEAVEVLRAVGAVGSVVAGSTAIQAAASNGTMRRSRGDAAANTSRTPDASAARSINASR